MWLRTKKGEGWRQNARDMCSRRRRHHRGRRRYSPLPQEHHNKKRLSLFTPPWLTYDTSTSHNVFLIEDRPCRSQRDMKMFAVVKPMLDEAADDSGNGLSAPVLLKTNPRAHCLCLGEPADAKRPGMTKLAAALPKLSPSSPRAVPAPYLAAPGRSLHAWRRYTRRPSSVCKQGTQVEQGVVRPFVRPSVRPSVRRPPELARGVDNAGGFRKPCA